MNFNALEFFNPIGFRIEKTLGDLFTKTTKVIGSNIQNQQNPFASLSTVLNNPTAPVIINQPPKQGLDALGVGFVEKNLIIVGIFALGGLFIWRSVK